MNLKKFMDILSYKRGHDSDSADAFIEKYIKPLKPELDGGGNFHVTVGEGSKTIFSTHFDTVHRTEGKQKVVYCPITNELYLDDKKDNCLGADDGAGLYLALSMIEHKVPGRYIFHAGEECGGIGSMWLAKNQPDLLRGFDRAVALDRGGITDVITHQGGIQCASPDFGRALANSLTRFGMVFSPSDRGVFTDTANYKTLIPECTNISVGYSQQHTNYEVQNLPFLSRLERLLHWIDWEKLPVKRKVTSDIPAYSSSKRRVYSFPGTDREQEIERAYENWMAGQRDKDPAVPRIPKASDLPIEPDDDLDDDLPAFPAKDEDIVDPRDFGFEDWAALCESYPQAMGELILSFEVTPDDLYAVLEAWNIDPTDLIEDVEAEREARRVAKIQAEKKRAAKLKNATAAPPQPKAAAVSEQQWSVQ